MQSAQGQTIGVASYTPYTGDQSSSNEILAIPVKGEIAGEPADPSTPDPTLAYGYTIADEVATASKDDSVKAIVLIIDSPGGAIYGARAIADAVAKYRSQTKRPVVAEVAGEADSGAYWVAASTDAIWADYGTDIGSIGVISGPYRNYANVTSITDPTDGQVVAGAITSLNITAGAGKSEGDPYRELTPQEQANIQDGVNNDYEVFANYVASRRHIDLATVTDKIGAYSYDPTSALSLKLIDKIAGRSETFDEAAHRAGLKLSDYKVVTIAPATSASSPSPNASPANAASAECGVAMRMAIAPGKGCYNK